MASKIETEIATLLRTEMKAHGFIVEDCFRPGDKIVDGVSQLCAERNYHPKECGEDIENLIDCLMALSVKLGMKAPSPAEKLDAATREP